MNKPNILMIMCDQLRSDWLGYAGTGFVNTPNIDRIAQKGINFTRAACNSPVCVPSRASMTAGLYGHRIGVLDNFVNYPIDQPTVYQALRRDGYRVALAGKTDLHKYDLFYGEDGDNPILYHWGFTDPHETIGKMAVRFYGQPDNNCPYKKYLLKKDLVDTLLNDYKKRVGEGFRGDGRPVWEAAESALSAEDNHDSYIGRKSCEFLKNISDRSPWHLFVSFVGPHDPWDPAQEYLEDYKDKVYPGSIEDTMEGKPEWVKKKSKKHSEGMKDEDLNKVKQHYAAMISLIDHQVGKMLDILDQRGMIDNTVIIFTADHGEMMGDHGLFQKSVMYEGSIRVPLIIADPRIGRQGTSDALAELVDMFPTMLDLAGIEYDSKKLDGKSLVPILKGETEQHKSYQLSELENCRMVFDGRYKFIENKNDKNELYDLLEDPEECINLVAEKPKLAAELGFKVMHQLRK